MIAPIKKAPRKKRVPAWHPEFLALLPKIRTYAQSAFRGWRREAREDAVAEVVAYALVAFHRLMERGKGDLAYATPLAMYGVRQFKAGRKVGNHLNVNDIMSRHAQRVKKIHVERLDRFDTDAEE
jgi:hypothetical protein